jgi:hypothetical protein
MCRNYRRWAKSVLFSVGSEDFRSLRRPPFGKIRDAYVEAIYAYAKAHSIAVVRFADACEVILSSLSVRRPREFGACWLGSRLWQELGLDEFFSAVLHDRRGSVEWAKVIELLAVNRLVAPESELGVHQGWYATTAMDVVLGTDDAVAAKDRLYRGCGRNQIHNDIVAHQGLAAPILADERHPNPLDLQECRS